MGGSWHFRKLCAFCDVKRTGRHEKVIAFHVRLTWARNRQAIEQPRRPILRSIPVVSDHGSLSVPTSARGEVGVDMERDARPTLVSQKCHIPQPRVSMIASPAKPG